MTPKEQANELLNNMLNIPDGGLGSMGIYEARQCALVAVNKLIEVAHDDQHFKHTEFTETHPNYKAYWKLVKKELEYP